MNPLQVESRAQMKRAIALGGLTILMCVSLSMFKEPQAPHLKNPSVKPVVVNDDSETRFLDSHPSMQPALNLADLRAKLRADSTLAEFDRKEGFDINCATMDTLTEGGWYKVSWRKGDTFGFSSHDQYLPAGTAIFNSCTGGMLKAKCGNVIQPTYRGSLDPQEDYAGPILVPHDDGQVLMPATIGVNIVPDSSVPLPGVGTNPHLTGEPYWPPVGGGAFYVGGGVPPVKTDEPSTMSQVVGGMLMGLYLWIRRKPRT